MLLYCDYENIVNSVCFNTQIRTNALWGPTTVMQMRSASIQRALSLVFARKDTMEMAYLAQV